MQNNHARSPAITRTALLGLALLLSAAPLRAGSSVHRVNTDNGEIVITTNNADVEVVVKQNGKLVRIIDTVTGKEVTLTAGLYDSERKTPAGELKLAPDRVTVYRGKTALATIERRSEQRKAEPAAPPAEIARDAFNGDNDVPAHVYRMMFAPDGKHFLAAGDAGGRSPVRLYDAATGKVVRELVPDEDAGWSSGCFSPDSRTVVTWGTNTPRAYVWETATGKLLRKLEGHREAITAAAFARDGKRLITGSTDHTLRIWEAATGKEQLVLEGHDDDCVGLFSPDGKWAISYSTDHTIRAWDAATGKLVWKQAEQSEHAYGNAFFIGAGCFAHDGKLVLSVGADGGVRLWETATGKLFGNLSATGEVHGATFLHEGRQLAAWSKDRTLRLWDVPGRRLVHLIELGEDLQGEPDNVRVSPDGRLLVTGHSNQIVQVRALPTGKKLHEYQTQPQTGTRILTVAPDSRSAAAGSFRGWVYLWRLPVPQAQR